LQIRVGRERLPKNSCKGIHGISSDSIFLERSRDKQN
jgi:hypothetical protein